jgi:hypothetical protein
MSTCYCSSEVVWTYLPLPDFRWSLLPPLRHPSPKDNQIKARYDKSVAHWLMTSNMIEKSLRPNFGQISPIRYKYLNRLPALYLDLQLNWNLMINQIHKIQAISDHTPVVTNQWPLTNDYWSLTYDHWPIITYFLYFFLVSLTHRLKSLDLLQLLHHWQLWLQFTPLCLLWESRNKNL